MTIWNDLRFVARILCKEPGFAAVAALTVALGVGANTAIFSIVNGVLLWTLPYPDPDRLVALQEVIPALEATYPLLPVSARHFMEWRERTTSFEALSAMIPGSANLAGAGEPERLDAARVSANVFDTLGVKPALGRGFMAGEDQAGRDRVAILSDSLWWWRFHSDPAIVGKTITLDAQAHTVVGVLPPSFRAPAAFPLGPYALLPRSEVFRPVVFPQEETKQLMGAFNYGVIGRLKKVTQRERGLAELNVIAAQLEKVSGEKVDLHASVTPLQDMIVGESRRGLLVLFGAVGAVLLVGCVNLANLTLARGSAGHTNWRSGWRWVPAVARCCGTRSARRC